MEKFIRLTGLVAPLDRVNVDTDQIIPKQFLKRIERTGFGEFLFFDWRYLADGKTPNPEFELNQPGYKGAQILVAGRNFGCGSSREHAPWALCQYGFRALIATEFADIFYNNCFKNGILPVKLDDVTVNRIMTNAKDHPGYTLTVDLESQMLTDDSDWSTPFEVDPFRKYCLLNGLDDIGLSLQYEGKISEFEKSRPVFLRGIF